MIELNEIHKNYQAVQEQISVSSERSGRTSRDVKLVVVTKGHSAEAIHAVVAAGARMLGENYVEAAVPKIEQLKSLSGIQWHMIGHIQSRKARTVCQYFHYVHSLDSIKLANRLDRFAADLDISLPVLLECNISGEDTKYGFSVWREFDLPAFFTAASNIVSLPHLTVHGLMAMAPFFEDAENARPYFKQLRKLQSQLSQLFPKTDWRELSMGMSGDFQVAIEEGATLVRIGTAIMGARPGA